MAITIVGNGSAVFEIVGGYWGIRAIPAKGHFVWKCLAEIDGSTHICPYSQICSEYLFVSMSFAPNYAQTVYFSPITTPYQIIAFSNNAGGSISPAGASFINPGGSKSYTITPNAGYEVDFISINKGQGTPYPEIFQIQGATSYTFSNVLEDSSIIAYYKTLSLSISATVGPNGSINPAGSSPVTVGQTRSYAITPNSGYQIDVVTVDGVPVGSVPSYTFSNISTSHTIHATFKVLDGHLITAVAGENGSISPSGSVVAVQGTNKSFTITPNPHCSIADVLVDGVSIGAVSSYIFTNVQAAHSITASFVRTPYYISSTAGANGQIVLSGEILAYYGESKSFVITPDEGYMIQDVFVDGTKVTIPESGILFID